MTEESRLVADGLGPVPGFPWGPPPPFPGIYRFRITVGLNYGLTMLATPIEAWAEMESGAVIERRFSWADLLDTIETHMEAKGVDPSDHATWWQAALALTLAG